MKAVILAAGKGTRIASVTGDIPKPLIEVRGKSLLDHNIDLCVSHGIRTIFINTHHQAEMIKAAIGDGSRWGISIEYSVEPELLGTAGALANFRSGLGDDPFFVLYGDNLSQFDLQSLVSKHHETKAPAVIAFHHREDVSSSGVAEFDQQGMVVRFIEKPREGETTSKWVNAGIYYLQPEVHRFIEPGFCDFARNVFPAMLQSGIHPAGVCSLTDVDAFDTPEMYFRSVKRHS